MERGTFVRSSYIFAIFRRPCTMSLGPAKRALILSIVGVSGSEVRVPPAAIYGAARAVNSNGLSHRGARPAPPAPLYRPRPVVPTP
ncbi:unnamed protein product [Pieris brassicae]|uniref:Uncharacterized protein n=1 Tax=Pieris brassicae TaxID=7116 RepID=A0A9P0X4W4_PIEBR|nr:unnamed protein product [Pieris brassicae]